MQLKREIGLIGLTFVAVSGIIGSGWLFAPLLAAQLAGPASLIAWLIGGVAMLLLAITFAEISALLPVPGGIARVPQFSHGNVVSMAMGWSAWIGYNSTAPIETEAMLRYLAPHADWLYSDMAGGVLSWAGIAVATLFLVLFTVINAYGVRFFAAVNTSITWIKLAVPFLVIAVLLISHFDAANFTAAGGFAPGGVQGILAAVSTGGVIFSYLGFRHAIDMAGEARNPQFTIPAALILSIVICFLIYGGMQVAFIGALEPAALSAGWSNLQLGHDLGPLAGVASALGLLWLVSVLNVGAVVGPFGGGLVAVGSNARLALALAQNGFFPALFERLSRYGVPFRALLLNLAVAILMFILFPFQEVVNLNGAAVVLSFVVGPLAVVALRQLLPAARRSFRVPAVAVIAPLGFVIATLVVYWSGWDTVWRLGVCFAIGLVLFLLKVWRTRGVALDLREAAWLAPYLLGLGVISFLGGFGGGIDLLPLGWDLLVCATFALAIFRLAAASRLRQPAFDRYLAEEAGFERGEYGGKMADAPLVGERS